MKYQIPPLVGQSASDLIQRLLVRKPNERLGNLAKGYVDVKQHEWFTTTNKINFRQLLRKEFEAPWKPRVSDPFDTSNFDTYYSDSERELSFSKRLTKDEQAIFKGF